MFVFNQVIREMSPPDFHLHTAEQPLRLIGQNKFTVLPFMELAPENFPNTWRTNSRIPIPVEKHVSGTDMGHGFPVWFTRKRRLYM